MKPSDEKLFTTLAQVGEQRVSEFQPQNLAGTAWAFAKATQSVAAMFLALAKAATLQLCEFDGQVSFGIHRKFPIK